MFIRDIFDKNIERNIQSVVKASDCGEKSLSEIDEYVVTKEIFRCIKLFVRTYRFVFENQDDKIGFWISGSFGSGKSHFLKILYYILEGLGIDVLIKNNKDLNELREDFEFISGITKDVILFNIDSKNRKQDNLLDIFVNEFNSIRGFSKSYGFICEFEEQLLKEGVLQKFKNYFLNISSTHWEEAREEFYFYKEAVFKTLSYVKGYEEHVAEEYFLDVEKNYRMNIERFCEKVSEYIKSKGENHSVIFMIDEVSQFISDDLNKMLSLQTIVEELSNRCFGKAFVVVTSHVDVDSMIEDKKYDFSKIQSRFESKLYLSSMNIDEVLCKRLLCKKEEFLPIIYDLYKDREFFIRNNLKFNFVSDSEISKINREEFASFYPFFSYQLKFIRDIIYFMMKNNVISDDISKGERSILSFFQRALMDFKDYDFNVIIPFYLFYDSILDFVDYNHKFIFQMAENCKNLNKFDLNLLKVLFLIKYLPNVISSVETLSSLMVSNIYEGRNLKLQVIESLEKLVKECFVRSDGDKFYFLSKVERNINYKIMETPIDSHEIKEFLYDKIFNNVCNISRVKYLNKVNFSFNKILDDLGYKVSSKNLIGVKIISTNYDENFNLDSIRIASSIENNVIVYFNNDKMLIDEVSTYLKFEKFLKYHKENLRDDYKNALLSRESEIKNRVERINILIVNSIKTSSIFVNGEIVSKNFENVEEIFKNSLTQLISCRFSKFGYINKFIDKFKYIDEIFKNQNQLNEIVELNSLFINELMGFINQFEKINFESVFEYFRNIPYGFGRNDILFAVLYLMKIGKVVCESSINEIIEGTVSNKNFPNKLEIIKSGDLEFIEFNSYRKIFEQIFDKKYLTNNFHDFLNECREDLGKFKIELYKIKILSEENNFYPGKKIICEIDDFISNILICEPEDFIKHLVRSSDIVKSFDEFDLVKNFYNSVQFEIFNEGIRVYEIFEKDKNFIYKDSLKKSFFVIQNILKMESPYGEISKLKLHIKEFLKLHNQILNDTVGMVDDFIENEILTFIGLDLVCELKNKLKICCTLFDVYGVKMESIFLKENLKRLEL